MLLTFCTLAWDLVQNKMHGLVLIIGSIEKLKVNHSSSILIISYTFQRDDFEQIFP